MVTSPTNNGRITQVIGSTLDAEFPEDRMPSIYNALTVEVERAVGVKKVKETLTCEVASHLGGGRVRAVALGTTDGLRRGMEIIDTGSSVRVPVGKEVLGRVFNLLGEPIDGLGPVTAKEMRPIHHGAAKF